MRKLTIEFRAVIRNPDTGLYGQSAEFEITACPDLLKNLDLGDELNMMFHEALRKLERNDPWWHEEHGYHTMTKAESAELLKQWEQDRYFNAHS